MSPSLQQPAAPAEFTEDTGAVEGVIVGEDFEAIAGAEVAIPDLSLQTLSDPDGRFTFSRLAPGAYTVLAVEVGYESASAQVNVVAGQKIPLTIQLVRLPTVEAYRVVQTQSGIFGCGASWRPAVAVSGIAACGIITLVAPMPEFDQFLITWEVNKTSEWQASVFEMKWQSSQTFGRGLSMIWEVNNCPNSAPHRFVRADGSSVLRAEAGQTVIQSVVANSTAAGSECEGSAGECNPDHCQLMSRVFSSPDTLGSSSPGDIGVTTFQTFEQTHTAFFNGPAPAGYTAYAG